MKKAGNIIAAVVLAALLVWSLVHFSSVILVVMDVMGAAVDTGGTEFINPDDAFTPTLAPTPLILTEQDYDDMSAIPAEAPDATPRPVP